MDCFKYTKIPFCWIPEEICIHYNLYPLVEPGGYVYIKVRKGMYVPKKSSRLNFDNIVKLLGS